MVGAVILSLLSAIIVVALIITIKARKRSGKSEAEREQQIAALLASARVEAMKANTSPQSVVTERQPAPEQTDVPKAPAQRDMRYLLDEQQQLLYRRLLEAVPALRVFPHVAMTQVLDMQRFRKDGPAPLAEMSLDFVICHPEDMSILAAIELTLDGQNIATEKKRIVMDQSGISFVVLGHDQMPDVIGLRKALAPHIAARRKINQPPP